MATKDLTCVPFAQLIVLLLVPAFVVAFTVGFTVSVFTVDLEGWLVAVVVVFAVTEGSGATLVDGAGAEPCAIPCRFLGIVTFPANGLESPASLNEYTATSVDLPAMDS